MLKIIFVIIGSLVGAGFASGREIYIFFLKHSSFGVLGIFITGITFSIIIYKALIIIKTFEIGNYDKFLTKINWKHEAVNKFINLAVNIFLLISFYIMVAGFGAYIKQTYNIEIFFSNFIFILICYIVFRKNVEGVIKVNQILVPILIFLIIYLGIKNIPFLSNKVNIIQNMSIIEKQKNISNIIMNNWFISSILYTSYNSIILIPVLTSLRKYIKNKKQIIKISIVSGLIIIVLSLIIYGLLLRDTYFITQIEMPLTNITFRFGNIFKYIYGFIIVVSIFTSAISAGYSCLKNMTKSKKGYNNLLCFMCLSSFFISNIGFSRLVEILYPLFGIFGIIQIFYIFKYYIK